VLRTQQPYQDAYEGDLDWMGAAMVKHYRGDDSDLKLLMLAVPRAFESLTVGDYDQRVKEFFDQADNPGLKRPYRERGYLPMIELLRYLEANGFATYIASGGDRDFMRPVAEDMYGIPPERIIGSALGITYSSEGGQSALMYRAPWTSSTTARSPHSIWSRSGGTHPRIGQFQRRCSDAGLLGTESVPGLALPPHDDAGGVSTMSRCGQARISRHSRIGLW
jgi:hypothetical protein